MDTIRYELDLLKAAVESHEMDEVGEKLEEIKGKLYEVRHVDTGELKNPLVDLADALEGAFSKAELEDLAFGLNVDLENVRGETKRDLVVNLITYFQRRGHVGVLVAEAQEARPDKGFGKFLDEK